ncbi:MAG: hypothetical protein JWM68_1884 [Verrucomicrobiales bacterium]|nr:hypothetical protein [Verrucomicrobiales bacterium]
MEAGHIFREGFEELMRTFGSTLIIHTGWNTLNQAFVEVQGMKNNQKNRPDKVMFQFPQAVNEVQTGSIIQMKGARDLFRVVDTEDKIIAGVFVHFTAHVEKLQADGTPVQSQKHGVVFNAPVQGGVQIGGYKNVQSIQVQNSDLARAVSELRVLLQKAQIPEINRDDGMEALQRIEALGSKPKSNEVYTRVKDRLEVVKNVFAISKDVALIAAPYIDQIARFF